MDSKEKQQTTRQKIIQATLDTVEFSSLHGMPSLVKNEHLQVKFIWICCILASGSYCCFTIYNCISQYFEYQAITQIDVAYYSQMRFPLVKFCRSDLSIPSSIIDSLKSNISNDVSNALSLQLSLNFLRNYLKNSTETIKENAGLRNLSDFVITCIFNLIQCNFTQDFDSYYDYYYGGCFRFNSGKNIYGKEVNLKNSVQTGPLNGLQIEFYIGKASSNLNLYSFDNSFNLMISDEPIDSSIQEGIRIPTGYSTHVILEKYSIVQLPQPYSSCIDKLISPNSYGSDLYAKTFSNALKQSKSYHYSNCRLICFQKYLGNQCKCQNGASDSFYDSMKICLSQDELLCSIIAWTSFLASVTCDCPLECASSDYSLTTSFSDYPTKYYSQVLAENSLIKSKLNQTVNNTSLRESILSVNIYFNQLKETLVTHDIKILPSDLLALIGGNLGLFLGISFLSFVELIEISMQTLIIVAKEKMAKSKISTENIKTINVNPTS